MSPSIMTAAISALALALTLVSCSGTAENAATPAPEPTAAIPEASIPPETAGPEAETSGTTPRCESIISLGTVEALTAAGWTAEQKEFLIGDVPLPDGLLCFWGGTTPPAPTTASSMAGRRSARPGPRVRSPHCSPRGGDVRTALRVST